jgi:predicted TIM-barrel fold metal-dependent hydrolase
MRRIIDAHVHIRPEHLCGTTDPVSQIKMDTYGRMQLPDGAIYQCMPPYFKNSCFSASDLIQVMDIYGVEKAVILQSLSFQINPDLIAAVRRYPERLRGAAIIEPRDERVLKDIEYLYEHGLTGIKFEMSEALGHCHPNAFPDMKFDSELFGRIYELTDKLRMTVTVDPSPIFGPGYQVEELEHAVSSHPTTRFVICHLGFPSSDLSKNAVKKARWKEMLKLAGYKNVWFDVAALSDLFSAEGYPFCSAMELLQEFITAYGTEKVIWGSDIPGSLNAATYPQMIKMFERCNWLKEEDLDRLFYRNALEAYF